MSGCCMARFSDEAPDGVDKSLPRRPVSGQRSLTTGRQRIYPSLSPGLRRGPPAAEQAHLFQTMERRINGSFRQIEIAAAAPTDFLDHRITMRGTIRERRQNDHLKMTLQYLAVHEIHIIPSVTRRQYDN